MVLCRIDAAKDYTARCGGYGILPHTRCSPGGVAVRLELIVQGWEGSVAFPKSRAAGGMEDGFVKAGTEADDAIESFIILGLGNIRYCQLDTEV